MSFYCFQNNSCPPSYFPHFLLRNTVGYIESIELVIKRFFEIYLHYKQTLDCLKIRAK